MVEAGPRNIALRHLGMLLIAAILLWPSASRSDLASHHFLDGRARATSENNHSEEGGLKESLFKWVNFLVLFGGLGYFLRKPMQQFLAARREDIRKSLEEARTAKEKAERDLAQALARLEQVEEEMASLKTAAVAEMEADRRQILEGARREAEQIIASARDEVALLVKNAQKDLREHSAALVVELAEQQIKLQIRPENQGRLFQQFASSLEAKTRSNPDPARKS
ncbi:MAG: ATP synthase F0 subunit B [Acidobacteriia bacterium]|nr:ATP synthase F0 subunit B [Terriglobia bacterium]